ncbi:hypothetical protein D9V37_01730 [Nocardioides mangrovicus]|uniref:Uncharacterized protein n=1 Tax=Nocardioides mangrovicus TaxID=2478913 RepID=A0A3L8P704_9ACTN|nr:hypothetical protein [Nocardioides mangrovicus]RLV50712.1 hypothetical protein D9V37_01730 [Nocardioides mangrovicus]
MSGRLLLALSSLVLVGACGIPGAVSTADRPDISAAPPSMQTSPSAHPVVKHPRAAKKKRAAKHGWERMHDASGVGFAMPSRHQGVQNGLATTYEDLSSPITYRVDVFHHASASQAALDASSMRAGMTALLTSAGFPNPSITSTGSGSTRDFTVNVVGTGIQADLLRYERIRTYLRGTTMTMVWTYGVGKDGAPLRHRVDAAQARLLGTVRWG